MPSKDQQEEAPSSLIKQQTTADGGMKVAEQVQRDRALIRGQNVTENMKENTLRQSSKEPSGLPTP